MLYQSIQIPVRILFFILFLSFCFSSLALFNQGYASPPGFEWKEDVKDRVSLKELMDRGDLIHYRSLGEDPIREKSNKKIEFIVYDRIDKDQGIEKDIVEFREGDKTSRAVFDNSIGSYYLGTRYIESEIFDDSYIVLNVHLGGNVTQVGLIYYSSEGFQKVLNPFWKNSIWYGGRYGFRFNYEYSNEKLIIQSRNRNGIHYPMVTYYIIDGGKVEYTIRNIVIPQKLKRSSTFYHRFHFREIMWLRKNFKAEEKRNAIANLLMYSITKGRNDLFENRKNRIKEDIKELLQKDTMLPENLIEDYREAYDLLFD